MSELNPSASTKRSPVIPGREAVKVKGWWQASKWLVLRRISQFGILGLFLLGPLAGIWIVKGNLSSSLTLGVLPLTDPLLVAQTMAAGQFPYQDALLGAAIVIGFYLLVGGRVFCSWVCPINPVSDAAAWLRRKLNIKGGSAPSSNTRYWLLGGLLLASFFTGSVAWEYINPVSMLHRGLIFGMGLGWLIVLAIFIYDLLIASRGWCGHLCPMGASYALLNRTALIRVSASERKKCDDCMDCIVVCPEPKVIRPALKGAPDSTPLILDAACTNCGRCIDVCALDVFHFSSRLTRQPIDELK